MLKEEEHLNRNKNDSHLISSEVLRTFDVGFLKSFII